MLFFGEHGIFEEGAGAEAVRISRGDEHTLEGADMAHSLAGFGEIGRCFAAFEVAF